MNKYKNTFYKSLLVGTISALPIGATHAASPVFEAFLNNACTSGGASADFSTRCAETNNGNLSTSSEDSLNPTQSLSNNSNALAETRSRIKAIMAKIEKQREGKDVERGKEDSVNEIFQASGFSALANWQQSDLDRDLTALERGYTTDSGSLQIGTDYRLSDDAIVGVLLGFSSSDTTFDADLADVNNFTPGNTEGDSDTDSVSISVFSSKNLGNNIYIEGLLSYAKSDYTFRRIVVYQDDQGNNPIGTFNTTSDTSGNQLAASVGVGMDNNAGAYNYGVYGRVNTQKSTIDAYTETGGQGLDMSVAEDDSSETVGTLGVKLRRSINTQSAVVVPQVFVEYENILSNDTPSTSSTFVQDTNNNSLVVTGDEVDDSYWRAGFGVSAGFANGLTAFFSWNKDFSKDFIDQSRYTIGARKEF